MTKKDYVTFARMIRSQRHQVNLLTPTESEHEAVVIRAKTYQINSIVDRLCEIFAADNSQFNKSKFIAACEIDTESK